MRLAITSEDEVGDLARRFNTFTDKLNGIVQGVVEKSEEKRMSSNQFSELSQDMNSEVKDMAVQTLSTASARRHWAAPHQERIIQTLPAPCVRYSSR